MHRSSTELIAAAVNARSITSSRGILDRLFNLSFGRFVYNQIWEDPVVDAEALRLDANSRMVTISSGGCNVLNYLIHDVASIDAVDLNVNHLQLLKLKLVGLRNFAEYEDFFEFFGNAKEAENVERYERTLRLGLDESALRHWEGGKARKGLRRERYRYFEKGLWKRSSLGMFLSFMRGLAKRKGMRPARLLECTAPQQQEAVFAKEIAPFFKIRAVKEMVKLPFFLHGLGVPPRQYETFKNEAAAGGILEEYFRRIWRLACQFPIQDNYFAWQAFGGRYDTINRRAIPDYLKKENFAPLKARAGRVRTHLISMTEFLATQPTASLNRFVLLDSQDWMTPEQMSALWRQIHRVGQRGTRIILRSGTSVSPVEGALPTELRRKFTYQEALSKSLFARDRSSIYGGFHLYTMD
jgi:S-adenosylmethionine-diacylglycerol 3-amino-3-carboxypropyl transferase